MAMELAWSTSMVRSPMAPPTSLTRLSNNAVEFRMVVFRPFKGEVMLGRIRSSTPAGINLRTDFFDDIFVPFEELPEGAE